jgi:hypothetical protein
MSNRKISSMKNYKAHRKAPKTSTFNKALKVLSSIRWLEFLSLARILLLILNCIDHHL